MAQLNEHFFHYMDSGVDKTLFYLDGGPSDGPLLVFMHGWPAIARLWQPQLSTFADLGFRVIAPDMPGYGQSTSRHVYSDYAIETIVTAMLLLLAHIGREQAVWIGHDWGCGPLWGIASHHPEVVRAAAGLAVPFRSIEMGLPQVLKFVNRTIYPEEKYPWGQWSYVVYYEQSFENATEWFEKDIAGFIKAQYTKPDPASYDRPTFTADVVRDGGWFGGIDKPPSTNQTPDSSVILDEHLRAELVAAMGTTGFWGADAWYMNSKRDHTYAVDHWVNNGVLEMPVLYIGAKYDTVIATSSSDSARPMRQHTKNLTYVPLDTGHYVAQEKPQEVNAALARWLLESVGGWWPQ